MYKYHKKEKNKSGCIEFYIMKEENRKEIIITSDGSKSVFSGQFGEAYHSRHGALQESMHVFIEMGWRACIERDGVKECRVLEVGFGTGLNALLTLNEALRSGVKTYYTGIELYPLTQEEAAGLEYEKLLKGQVAEKYVKTIHELPWDEHTEPVPDVFYLQKLKIALEEYSTGERFDLIYFDAFSSGAQPELWTREIFDKMFALTVPGGLLVTYSAKGSVRRAMLAAGYEVERLPGPPGKREMLCAWRMK